MFAVNRSTGAVAWEITTGAFIDSSPAYHEGVLFIGSNDGIALDAANGSIEWQTIIGRVRFSSATLSNGHLYIGGQASVSSLRQSDGALRWSRPTTGVILSSPAVDEDAIYIGGGGDNQLYALRDTGEQIWKTLIGPVQFSAPALAGDTVFLGSLDNSVYALDADTGGMDVRNGRPRRFLSLCC